MSVGYKIRLGCVMTPDQAELLYDLVKEHREAIIARRSFGILDGLLQALAQIDRGGGAYVRDRILHYGGELIEAGIIPASMQIAWLGARAPIPAPYWDVTATVPRLSLEYQGQKMVWQPVSICRATGPLAIVPLATAVLPPLPLR